VRKEVKRVLTTEEKPVSKAEKEEGGGQIGGKGPVRHYRGSKTGHSDEGTGLDYKKEGQWQGCDGTHEEIASRAS